MFDTGLLTQANGQHFTQPYDFCMFAEKDKLGDDGFISESGYLETNSTWSIHVPSSGKTFQVKITRLASDRSFAAFVVLKSE